MKNPTRLFAVLGVTVTGALAVSIPFVRSFAGPVTQKFPQVDGKPSNLLRDKETPSPSDGLLRFGKPIAREIPNIVTKISRSNLLPGVAGYALWSDLDDFSRPVYYCLEEYDDRNPVVTSIFPLERPDLSKIYGQGVKDYRTIFNSKYSPDGNKILLWYGGPGDFNLYVFDKIRQTIRLVLPDKLRYYHVSWSPDSKFIAFIRGGDVDPRINNMGLWFSGQGELCLCEVASAKVQVVRKGTSLRGIWGWDDRHNLVYGALSTEEERLAEANSFDSRRLPGPGKVHSGAGRQPIAPNVYEYDPEHLKTKLLFSDGYQPLMSPPSYSKKLVACIGSSDPGNPSSLPADWQTTVGGRYVIVYDCSSGHTNLKMRRQVLGQHYGKYPVLRWLPNEGGLLVMWESTDRLDTVLTMELWNVKTNRRKVVAIIKARDAIPRNPDSNPVYECQDINSDGSKIMLSEQTIISLGPRSGHAYQLCLKQISVDDGKVTDVACVSPTDHVIWNYPKP